MRASQHRIFGITGLKNTGKTTLVSRLVEHFSSRGLTVSTLKHAHKGFDIDHEGRDSWRHRAAGATETAVVSPARWAIMYELRQTPEPSFTEILARMSPCDLILVEGYKQESHPKIELLPASEQRETAIWRDNQSIVAIAGDEKDAGDCPLPRFPRDDIVGIADFISRHLSISSGNGNDRGN